MNISMYLPMGVLMFSLSALAQESIDDVAKSNSTLAQEPKDDVVAKRILTTLYSSDFSELKTLMEQKANPDCQDGNGDTILTLAAKRADLTVVRYAIKQGCNLNWQNKIGFTPLAYALLRKDSGIAQQLLEAGADPNAQTLFGWAPIMYSVISGSDGLTRDLIKKGALLKNEWPFFVSSSVAVLIWNGDADGLKKLKSAGYDLNRYDSQGVLPLSYAIGKRDQELVDLLIRLGASAYLYDYSSRMTLMQFAKENSIVLKTTNAAEESPRKF